MRDQNACDFFHFLPPSSSSFFFFFFSSRRRHTRCGRDWSSDVCSSDLWYLALGPSAASFLPHDEGVGIRRTNAPIRTWLLGAPGEAQVVGAVEFTLEMLMTGLRTREGADLGRLVRLGGSDPRTLLAAPLERMVAGGLLELGGDTLHATPEGLAVLNGVLREFFAAAEGLR